jgi:hypothetical protein
MANLLGVGLAWLEAQRERHLTIAVIYRRPAGAGNPAQELTVPATVGSTTFEVVSAGGVLERIESRDYLIAAAALGALGAPQRGDQIRETTGGACHTAEVLAPGREPHWRWSDVNRTCYRIHTKHLQSEISP